MGTLSSPTLQSLLTEVRVQINSPDPLNSFWQDPELSGYLDDAVRRYFVEAVQANEGYFTTHTSLNLVAGVESVALPTDCFEVRAVYKKVTDGYVLLNYQNNITSGYSTSGGFTGDTYFPSYQFEGNNLVFRPQPSSSEIAGIKVDYTQFPSTMVFGGDMMTSQVSPIFKELIVMYAVYRAKLRESMVNGGTMQTIPANQVEALYGQFKSAITKRSKNPTYVVAFNPEES